ncbi:MAG: 5'-nucleotidase C-terminal domain-containing protein [Prevotella sp.]|nr:5'-nucleotidase C-terminal domain-containing protein [Prevotella sp.]
MNRKTLLTLTAILILCTGCVHQYQVTGVQRTRILVDNRYDALPNAEAEAFMQPYKQQVDSVMSPVVGRAARYLWAQKPESNLSNLLADIMVWGGKKYSETPDFGVYNVGGIRAAFSEGNVTYGDVLDVAPFENKICFLTLTGEKVTELFEQIASTRGEGVSHGVQLVITADGKLVSALFNGQPIDPKKTYRIATLDYLAQGNDKMEAFKAKTDVVSPQEEENNTRYIIMDYFREQAAKGQAVDAQVEGRIVMQGLNDADSRELMH